MIGSLQPLSPFCLLVAPLGSLQSFAAAFNRTLITDIPWLSPPRVQLLLLAPVLMLLMLSTLPSAWPSARVRSSNRLLRQLNSVLQHDWLFQLLLGIFIIAMRLPLLAHPLELNVDESTFIAGAAKLLRDPVFYRAVDTGTSGPVNIYPLLLPALFGLPMDYASARIVGLFLVWGVCVFLYRSLRLLAPQPLARFAILPLAGWFASVTFPDFTHYSSEHVPLFLISIAVWLCISIFRDEGYSRFAPAGLGIVCALLVLAKFQSIPIAAAIATSACTGMVFKKGADPRKELIRGPGLMLASMGAALALAYAGLEILGVAEDFRQYYIVRNLAYAQTSQTLYERLLRIWRRLIAVNDIYYFYLGVLVFLAVEIQSILRRWSRDTKLARRALTPFRVFGIVAVGLTLGVNLLSESFVGYGLLVLGAALAWAVLPMYGSLFALDFQRLEVKLAMMAALFLLASIYAAIAPGRGYEHYMLFLVTPLFLSASVVLLWDSGSAAVQKSESNPWLPGGCRLFFILLFVVPFFHNRLSIEPGWTFGTSAGRVPEAAGAILAFGHPGEYLDVWGWRSNLYVKTQMIQAAQHSDSGPELEDGPYRDYMRRRYIDELKRNRPTIFADAVGDNSFRYTDRTKYAHEQFPELAEIVASDYSYITEVDTVRIYLRKDLRNSRMATVLNHAGDDICNYRHATHNVCSGPVPRTFMLEAVVLPLQDQPPWATILGNIVDPPAGGFALQRFGTSDLFCFRLETQAGGVVMSPQFAMAPVKPHYIVVTIREKVLTVEVDDVMLAITPISGDPAMSSDAPVIGNGGAGDRAFRGVILEARISRRNDSLDEREKTWQRVRSAYGIK